MRRNTLVETAYAFEKLLHPLTATKSTQNSCSDILPGNRPGIQRLCLCSSV